MEDELSKAQEAKEVKEAKEAQDAKEAIIKKVYYDVKDGFGSMLHLRLRVASIPALREAMLQHF